MRHTGTFFVLNSKAKVYFAFSARILQIGPFRRVEPTDSRHKISVGIINHYILIFQRCSVPLVVCKHNGNGINSRACIAMGPCYQWISNTSLWSRTITPIPGSSIYTISWVKSADTKIRIDFLRVLRSCNVMNNHAVASSIHRNSYNCSITFFCPFDGFIGEAITAIEGGFRSIGKRTIRIKSKCAIRWAWHQESC